MLQLMLPRCTAAAAAAMARQKPSDQKNKKEAGPDLTATWQIYNDVAVVFLGQEAGSSSPRNEQQDNTAFNRLRQTDRLSDRLDRQV